MAGLRHKVLAGIVLASCLSYPDSTYARAGGGGSYSHESPSSSSSSSSRSSYSSSSRSSRSSSGSSTVEFNLSEMNGWQRAAFFGMIIGLPIGIIWSVMYFGPDIPTTASQTQTPENSASQADANSTGRSRRRKRKRPDDDDAEKSSDSVRQEIMSRDINFKPKAFLPRFDKAFVTIQNSWSQQNLETMRPFVTDGVYERFAIQLHEFKLQGSINKISNIRILDRSIDFFESDGNFDLLTVKVSAQMQDDFYNGKGKLVKSGDDPFVEYWTFLRHKDAKTKDQPGLIEAACPCCGASVLKNQNAKCDSCKSALRSGEFDWVLSEISQENTEIQSLVEPSAVKTIAAADPDFSVQLLEDRAAVIFWRIALAKRLKDARILEKVTYPENAKEMQKFLTCFDIGVGSIELDRIEMAGDQVTAELRVIWSSKNKPEGEISHGVSPLRLTRHKDGVSRMSRQLGAFHCAGCGAAMSDEVVSHCSHCGNAYYDPKNQWNLETFGDCGIKPNDSKIAS